MKASMKLVLLMVCVTAGRSSGISLSRHAATAAVWSYHVDHIFLCRWQEHSGIGWLPSTDYAKYKVLLI